MPKKTEPSAPQDFRALVREALAARGWSVYRLARESGLSQNTLNNWLREETQLSADRLEKAFAALGLRVEAASAD